MFFMCFPQYQSPHINYLLIIKVSTLSADKGVRLRENTSNFLSHVLRSAASLLIVRSGVIFLNISPHINYLLTKILYSVSRYRKTERKHM